VTGQVNAGAYESQGAFDRGSATVRAVRVAHAGLADHLVANCK